MPQLADITVKANNGTTDVVYAGQVPAAGDTQPAIWRKTAGAVAPALAPELRLVARDADGGKKRALRATFLYPQTVTDSTTGVTSVINRSLGATDFSFPKEMSQTDIDEAASQFVNLLGSALVKACLKAGYSAT